MLENSQQVPCEVVKIVFIELADDGAVDSQIRGAKRVFGIDENIAWMHVSVKKAVAKDLSEKDFYATLRQNLHINPLLLEGFYVGDRQAINTLTDHDRFSGERPVYLGYIDQVAAGKVSAQLRGIAGFTAEIELVEYSSLVICSDLAWLQSPPFL